MYFILYIYLIYCWDGCFEWLSPNRTVLPAADGYVRVPRLLVALPPLTLFVMQKRTSRFQGGRGGRLPPLLPSQLVAGVERRLEDIKRERRWESLKQIRVILWPIQGPLLQPGSSPNIWKYSKIREWTFLKWKFETFELPIVFQSSKCWNFVILGANRGLICCHANRWG